MKYRSPSNLVKNVAGFSLVELMVAVAIGLIVVLVTTQLVAANSANRQTISASTDGTVNGSLALYDISKEAARAGFGISSIPDLFGCTIAVRRNIPKADGTWVAQAASYTLAPAVIEQGANGAPDTITIISNHNKGHVLPTWLTTEYPAQTAAPFSNAIDVDSTFGINVGDVLLIAPTAPSMLTVAEQQLLTAALQSTTPGIVPALPASLAGKTWCSIFQATGDDKSAPQGVIHRVDEATPSNQLIAQKKIHRFMGAANYDRSTALNSRTSPYNDIPFPAYTTYPAGTLSSNQFAQSSKIYNLGPGGLQAYTFRIAAGQLESGNELLPTYPHIVQMQALYGKDTNNDGAVDTWDAVTPATLDGWKQVLALHVAVVARNPKRESTPVTLNTEACPNPTSVCWAEGKLVDNARRIGELNANNPNPDDWKYYRYRVFENTITFRNSVWNVKFAN